MYANQDGRTVVVYGAGGSVATGVARASAAAGAQVFLAGRNQHTLDSLAGELHAEGQVLDVQDRDAVTAHLQDVVDATERLDVVFNAVTYGDLQGQSLLDLDAENFADRMRLTTMAQFHVAQAAGQHMIRHGEGLISTVTGYGQPWPGMGTTAASWGLVEPMLRQWAADLGSSYTGDATVEEVLDAIRDATMLKSIPTIDDVGRAAVYLTTAPHITATAINLTAGAVSNE